MRADRQVIAFRLFATLGMDSGRSCGLGKVINLILCMARSIASGVGNCYARLVFDQAHCYYTLPFPFGYRMEASGRFGYGGGRAGSRRPWSKRDHSALHRLICFLVDS